MGVQRVEDIPGAQENVFWDVGFNVAEGSKTELQHFVGILFNICNSSAVGRISYGNFQYVVIAQVQRENIVFSTEVSLKNLFDCRVKFLVNINDGEV